MNHDDLLRMFDLDGKDKPATGAEPLIESVATVAKSRPESVSPTALRLDGWGLRRGEELLAMSEPIRQTLKDLGDREQVHAAADFHAAAFEVDPQLHEACTDPLRREFVRQLLETSEYRGLHAATMLDVSASEIAALSFAKQFAELRKEQKPPEKEEGAARPDDFEAEISVLKHVGRALVEASREVEEARDAAAAFGIGAGASGKSDPRTVAALYKRVRSDPSLRKICELAGRYRRVAQSRQRRKASHGLDDVVGVVMDADLGRLLPHELARLAMPEFEDDTLRRFVERQTMCREYRSTEPVGKGPILVSIDESGSMEGEKAHMAKALALALAWIARRQHRWCGLIAYSGDTGERLLPLSPGKWNDAALADWLAAFIGGGSSLDVPVRELPDYWVKIGAPAGRTDVVLITDAICRIPSQVRETFQAWKSRAKARVLTLVVDNEPGDLAAVSDETYRVPSLAVSEEAIGRVLEI
jgi:uncharacterized protein with von Willebrand factor type A (vWA) domain